MRVKPKKMELRQAGNTRNGRSQKVDGALVDPATGKVVVRDLRFHQVVAHQREFYFLNQTCDH